MDYENMYKIMMSSKQYNLLTINNSITLLNVLDKCLIFKYE